MESNNKIGRNSISENDALQKFRKFVLPLDPDVSDAVLMKFLRMQNFNLRKCEKVYSEYISSKLVYKTDDVDNYQMPEVAAKYEFCNYLGIAKDGSPVRYIAMGKGDFKGFLYSTDIIEICRYCSHQIEKDLRTCREQSQKLGKDINEMYYIADMEHFSIRQVFVSGMIELGFDMFQLLQDHYPEIWNRIFIVNAPSYFQTVFNIFKPILRHTFLQKVHVVSKERSTSLLLKYMDADILPVFLGGTRVDSFGNPMCTEFTKAGGIIPEEYYSVNCKSPLLPTDPGALDVWVSPRSYYNVPFVAREAESVVTVEIRTEGGSIGACILYKEFGADPEKLDLPSSNEYLDENDEGNPWKRISPLCHIQTHITPVDNHFHAPWPGVYIYRFDNVYNWLTSRRLICRVKVLPPGSKPL